MGHRLTRPLLRPERNNGRPPGEIGGTRGDLRHQGRLPSAGRRQRRHDSVHDYQADHCTTSQGRCLLILQARDQPGQAKVTASSEGLQGQSVELRLG
ncbi:hypothetical protein ACFL6X_02020 [Candidatus Latescibacterota bacterium]